MLRRCLMLASLAGGDEVRVYDLLTPATPAPVATLAVGEGIDSVAASPDGLRGAGAIENESDATTDGELANLDLSDPDPVNWTASVIAVPALDPAVYDEATDPQPEFVDIKRRRARVVTLQEQGAIMVADLVVGTATVFPTRDRTILGDRTDDGALDFTQAFEAEPEPDIRDLATAPDGRLIAVESKDAANDDIKSDAVVTRFAVGGVPDGGTITGKTALGPLLPASDIRSSGSISGVAAMPRRRDLDGRLPRGLVNGNPLGQRRPLLARRPEAARHARGSAEHGCAADHRSRGPRSDRDVRRHASSLRSRPDRQGQVHPRRRRRRTAGAAARLEGSAPAAHGCALSRRRS